MKNRKKLLITAIALGLSNSLWSATTEAPASPPPAPAATPAPASSAPAEKPVPSPAELAKEESTGFYPPAITEIFESAKKNGISGDWGKKIQITSQDYATMKEPRRAFQVGMTLADIAFLVLDNPAGPDAPPSKELVQQAHTVISAVNPPADILKAVQTMRDKYEAGSLKDKELRKAIDELINGVVPTITQSTDNAQRDTGELLMAAGYFKALYLGSETLAGSDSPKPEQLEMIQAWKGITLHTLEYLTKQTTPAFKDSVEVKNLLVALNKISPLVSKPRGQMTKEDAAQIATALKPLFG